MNVSGPAQKKARGGDPQTGSAAVVHGAAAKPLAPAARFNADALSCVFSFCSMQELLHLSCVSHDWHTAVQHTPVMKALRAVTALGASHVSAIAEVASKLNSGSQAAARLPHIISQQQQRLVKRDCGEVSAPLLTMLRTARLLRRGEDFNPAYAEAGVGGKADIVLQLPPSLDAGASAASSDPLRLSVEWMLGHEIKNEWFRDAWNIVHKQSAATGGREEPQQLFHMHVVRASTWETDSEEMEAKPLARLLEGRGILLGTPQQRSRLLRAFIRTLFALACKNDVLRGSCYQLDKRACDIACGCPSGGEEEEEEYDSYEGEADEPVDEEETTGDDEKATVEKAKGDEGSKMEEEEETKKPQVD